MSDTTADEPAAGDTGRYVVLHHTGHGPDHYDLLLALTADGPVPAWRLTAWPPGVSTTSPTAAVPLPEHRRHYLTHEGEVSGGRGRVRRVAEGVCVVVASGPDAVLVRLDGRPLRLPRRWSSPP